MAIAQVQNIAATIEQLKEMGLWIFTAALTLSMSLKSA